MVISYEIYHLTKQNLTLMAVSLFSYEIYHLTFGHTVNRILHSWSSYLKVSFDKAESWLSYMKLNRILYTHGHRIWALHGWFQRCGDRDSWHPPHCPPGKSLVAIGFLKNSGMDPPPSKTTVKTLLISTHSVCFVEGISILLISDDIQITSASNRCMSLFNFSLAVYCWPSSLRSSSNTWVKSLVCFAIEASHLAILARTSCNIVTWWTSSLFTALLVPTTAKSRPLISDSRAWNKY